MPYEEDQLARLDQAAVEMDHAEQVRHDRYVAEDAATVLARQREDELHAGGVKLREDRKAALGSWRCTHCKRKCKVTRSLNKEGVTLSI